MKKILATILFSGLFFVIPSSAILNTDYVYSPRIIAMGGAGVAAVDDEDAVFLNPAGLCNANNGIIGSYGATQGDVSQYYYAGDINLKELGGIGFGYNKIGVYGIPDPATGNLIPGGTFDFYSDDLTISYGHQINNWFSLGANVHRISNVFSSPNPSLESGSGYGQGVGIGFQFNLFQNISIGGLINDIYKTDFVWNTNEKETIPTSAAIGFAYRPISDKLLLALDFRKANIERSGGVDTIMLGTEIGLPVKFRFGYQFNKDRSSENYSGSGSVGIGVNLFNKLLFDYALQKSRDRFGDSQYFSVRGMF